MGAPFLAAFARSGDFRERSRRVPPSVASKFRARLVSYTDFRRLLAQFHSGAPQAPAASSAPNKIMASKLLRPPRDQYTSLRFSHSANSSSVSAAPTP